MERYPDRLSQNSSTPGRFRGRRRLVPFIVGLITGAFVARLGLELSGRPWPPTVVVGLGALLAGVGGVVAWRLIQHAPQERTSEGRRANWALTLLALYLVWPQRRPCLGVLLLMLVGLTLLLDWYGRRTRRVDRVTAESAELRLPSGERIADILTFTLSLMLYISTAAADVLPADSGEFQIVASLLGVAHPPGYPLYTMVGWLSTKLIPFGNEAYRLNLMSAIVAAGTLTLLGAAVRHWARRLGTSATAALVGGLAAALTLGTATTFWAQATVANIRMPTMFMAALGLYALARYAEAADQRQADHALMLLALALGLGVGHHPSLIFLGIFFLIYLVLVAPRVLLQPQRWWRPLLIFLIALLPLVYLPLRGAANARLAPPNLDTLDGFFHHATAQGFEGDMFAFANAEDLSRRLVILPTLFLFQFNSALLAAAALSLLMLAWRDWRLLVLLGGGLVLHTFVTVTYRAPQTVEYLMPAYLPIAILVGLTTAWLLSTLLPGAISSSVATAGARRSKNSLAQAQVAWRRHLSLVATLSAAAILLAGFLNGMDHGPSYSVLAGDHSTRTAMESILDQAPSDALVLADWHWATALWYLQWVEGQRPDVEVRYVWPVPGQEYPDTWRERIEENIGERPLLLTDAYEPPGFTLEPLGQGFWIHQRPYRAAPAGLTPLEAVFARSADEGKVRLLGYRLSRREASPSEALELALAWQPVGEIIASPSFTVWMTDNDGQRLTQADRYLVPGYIPGEVRFERQVLPLYPDTPPGEYNLNLQVYSTGEEGFETWTVQPGADLPVDSGTTLKLATLTVHPDSTQAVTLHPLGIPFEDGPTLVGVDYDRSMPGSLRLYLHWMGPMQGEEQIHVGGNTIQLPALPEDTYHTAVLDLPGETTGLIPLTLIEADGQTKTAAGPWGWSLRELRLPAPSRTARFVPLAGEMALIDVSPAGSKSFSPGDELLLRLTFLALKPLVDDDSISVRLLDENGQWRYLHDLQPALGAIPTLKWIRGSRVTDPHPLLVPLDIDGDVLRASLVVYERFRGNVLPPMDGRMDGVPLGEWGLEEH